MKPPITSDMRPVSVVYVGEALDNAVDALVATIMDAEYMEVPALTVPAPVLMAAGERGLVRVTRIDGTEWVRLTPDPCDRTSGAPTEAEMFTTDGASARAQRVWMQHLGVYRRVLETIREQTPHDSAAILAMECAVRTASRQVGIGYRSKGQR